MCLCEQASLTYSADGLFTQQQQSVIERAPYEKELPAGRRRKGRRKENNDDKEGICITK